MKKPSMLVIVALMLFLCCGSSVLRAEQSSLQQFGNFVSGKAGLQPKTLRSSNGDEVKIKWSGEQVDIQIVFKRIPETLPESFKIEFLDKDGFQMHDNVTLGQADTDDIINEDGRLIYRGECYLDAAQYRRIEGASIQF